jgi:hypothetical protein
MVVLDVLEDMKTDHEVEALAGKPGVGQVELNVGRRLEVGGYVVEIPDGAEAGLKAVLGREMKHSSRLGEEIPLTQVKPQESLPLDRIAARAGGVRAVRRREEAAE